MPANLNALIRYRTIDQCLSNPYREWTIGDLAEKCASALKEHRGIYSIFNVTINDSGLLSRVLEFILEVRAEIKHPEMEQIIKSITEAISESRRIEELKTLFDEEFRTELDEDLSMPMKAPKPGVSKSSKQSDRFPGKDLTWAEILNIIR